MKENNTLNTSKVCSCCVSVCFVFVLICCLFQKVYINTVISFVLRDIKMIYINIILRNLLDEIFDSVQWQVCCKRITSINIIVTGCFFAVNINIHSSLYDKFSCTQNRLFNLNKSMHWEINGQVG